MALRNQEIGGRLRELRGEKPQTTVADELGVAERTYQNWEAGDAKPSYRNLQRLAQYHGVREEFILTGTSETPSPFPADPETADERWARMEAAVEAHGATIRDLLERQNELLERQSEVLARIEAAIELEDASAGRLEAAVREAGQALRAGTQGPAPRAAKRAPKRSRRASKPKPA